MRTSINLLDPMGEVSNIIGQPMRGAGWLGPCTGLHTVAFCVLNFQGRISLQASLAMIPTEQDWFSVLPNSVAFWQYPRLNYIPTLLNTGGETSTIGFNFSCNALWVRALVRRDYLLSVFATPLDCAALGVIDSILLNY